MKQFLPILISLWFVSAIHSQNITGAAGKTILYSGKEIQVKI